MVNMHYICIYGFFLLRRHFPSSRSRNFLATCNTERHVLSTCTRHRSTTTPTRQAGAPPPKSLSPPANANVGGESAFLSYNRYSSSGTCSTTAATAAALADLSLIRTPPIACSIDRAAVSFGFRILSLLPHPDEQAVRDY